MTEFDSVIPPGGVGQVTAEIHTKSFKGAIAKGITVTSDDPARPSTHLTIKAMVRVAVDVEPRDFLDVRGEAGALAPVEATIFSVGGEPFDVLRVDARAEMLDVRVEPVAEAPSEGAAAADAQGAEPAMQAEPAAKAEPKAKPPKKAKKAARTEPAAAAEPAAAVAAATEPAPAAPLATGASRYRVTITPTDAVKPGRSSEAVTVHTSHPKAPTVLLRLSLSVDGPVAVRPERLDLRLDPAHPETKPMRTVVLVKEKGDPFAIEQVTATNAAFSTTLRTVEEGRRYAIDVSYEERTGQRTATGQLVVKTNVPEQPTVTVALVGRR